MKLFLAIATFILGIADVGAFPKLPISENNQKKSAKKTSSFVQAPLRVQSSNLLRRLSFAAPRAGGSSHNFSRKMALETRKQKPSSNKNNIYAFIAFFAACHQTYWWKSISDIVNEEKRPQ